MPTDVLVVANPYEAERLRRALVASGHRTVLTDGREGTAERIVLHAPGVVVVAQPLARGDAGALVREIRRRFGERQMPIILIGAAGPARSEDVHACFDRPIDVLALLKAIDDLGSASVSEVVSNSGSVEEPAPESAATPPPESAATLAPESAATLAPESAPSEAAPPAVQSSRAAPLPTHAPSTSPPPTVPSPSQPSRPHPGAMPRTPIPEAADLSSGGRLADSDVATILGRLYRQGFTGRLTVRQGGAEKNIFFDAGFPVFATSNVAQDHMSEQLLREGRLTRDQYEDCRNIVADTGRRTGAILADRGYLKESELLDEVRRHYEGILYSIFGWEEGEYEIDAGAPPVERVRLSSHPAALVVEGLRRRGDGAKLSQRIGGMRATLRPAGRDDLLHDAELGEDEMGAALLIDGHRTLGDVARRSGLSEDDVARLAWALLVLGVVRHPTAVVSVRTSEWELPADSTEIDAARVAARHGLVKEGDYFEVLGVSRDATRVEIERAHERARRQFAPEALNQDVASRMRVELEEISIVLDEALRILRDDERRGAYRETLD